jgi:acetyl-CoA carboxylase carboxyltransferase component
MAGGSMHEPLLTLAWPSAHLGPMGLEGAVRLALRRELDATPDEQQRELRVRELTAAAQENAKALNAATLFEIDDVIDPAETRSLIVATFAAATAHTGVGAWASRRAGLGTGTRAGGGRERPRFVDSW